MILCSARSLANRNIQAETSKPQGLKKPVLLLTKKDLLDWASMQSSHPSINQSTHLAFAGLAELVEINAAKEAVRVAPFGDDAVR